MTQANDTPLTQAQACLEALADYRPGTIHLIDGVTGMAEISTDKINALGRAYSTAQALVDTLSKQGEIHQQPDDRIELELVDCDCHLLDTKCFAVQRYGGDKCTIFKRKIKRESREQPTSITQQREGLRSIREALAKGRQYCDALNANIAGAIGNDNTVVRPDLNQIDSALTRIDRMIGCVE